MSWAIGRFPEPVCLPLRFEGRVPLVPCPSPPLGPHQRAAGHTAQEGRSSGALPFSRATWTEGSPWDERVGGTRVPQSP